MNIYEEEKLEKRFNEITDQLGYLLLDLFMVSLKKLNTENQIFMDFEDTRFKSYTEDI
jgi:hypothetical protein